MEPEKIFHIEVFIMQGNMKRKFNTIIIEASNMQKAIEVARQDYFFPCEVCEFRFV